MAKETKNKTEVKREKDNRNIGACWKKQGAKGGFLSGFIEIPYKNTVLKGSIFIFPNKFKDKDTSPDYRIIVSDEGINEVNSEAFPAASAVENEETEEVIPGL